MCVCVCVCVVSVIVKRPVVPPCVVDGRSRNPLYYIYVKKITNKKSCIFKSGIVHNTCVLASSSFFPVGFCLFVWLVGWFIFDIAVLKE